MFCQEDVYLNLGVLFLLPAASWNGVLPDSSLGTKILSAFGPLAALAQALAAGIMQRLRKDNIPYRNKELFLIGVSVQMCFNTVHVPLMVLIII